MFMDINSVQPKVSLAFSIFLINVDVSYVVGCFFFPLVPLSAQIVCGLALCTVFAQ